MRIPLPGLAFAAAMRMVDRIHDDTANVRPLSLPAGPSGFTDADILVIEIADLADGGHARSEDAAHFSRLQTNLHIVAIPTHDLRRSSGAPDQLTALTGPEFNIMDGRSQWHAGQSQGIPRPDFRLGTRLNLVVHLQSHRRQNVALFSIAVVQQGNARRAIGIVLNGFNACENPDLIPSKINSAIQALVPSPTKPNGHPAIVIPAAAPVMKGGQRLFRLLFRQFIGRDGCHTATAGRRRTK